MGNIMLTIKSKKSALVTKVEKILNSANQELDSATKSHYDINHAHSLSISACLVYIENEINFKRSSTKGVINTEAANAIVTEAILEVLNKEENTYQTLSYDELDKHDTEAQEIDLDSMYKKLGLIVKTTSNEDNNLYLSFYKHSKQYKNLVKAIKYEDNVKKDVTAAKAIIRKLKVGIALGIQGIDNEVQLTDRLASKLVHLIENYEND